MTLYRVSLVKCHRRALDQGAGLTLSIANAGWESPLHATTPDQPTESLTAYAEVRQILARADRGRACRFLRHALPREVFGSRPNRVALPVLRSFGTGTGPLDRDTGAVLARSIRR